MPVRIDRRASYTAFTAAALGAVVALMAAPALAQPVPPTPTPTPTPPAGATEATPPEKPPAPVDAPKPPPPVVEPAKVDPPKVEPVAAVKPTPAPEAPKPPPQSGFGFGSYGRMIAGTDFKGAPGRNADVVAHGSRLDESNYVELELRRDDYWQKTDSTTRLVATLAVANPIFHYNGDFNVKMAIRNLYIEERDLGVKDLSVWAGSRMYRGDDIYLLDFWPLDNLNTMGVGARYDIKKTFVALHAGFNQPNTPFYMQQVERPSPLNQMGAIGVNVLDRQRFIGSAKVSHIIPVGQGGIKGVLYAEAHQLSAGQRETQPRVFETLPSDGGYVLGAQIGAYTGERSGHVNLFFRYAQGLAAYGDFATPNQLSADSTTAGAHELVLAIGGNWETGPFGLLAGAYLRSFRNASPGLDFGDVDEAILAVRPNLFFGEVGGIALEGSYQVQQRGVVTQAAAEAGQPASTSGPFSAGLWRLGVMPFLSPAGRGDFSRPQFRAIYMLTSRNKGAQAMYPLDDVFSLRSTEHFFGLGAEWWFNSSSYSR